MLFKIVYVVANNTDSVFIIWFLGIALLNIWFIYRIAKYYKKHKEMIVAGIALLLSLAMCELTLRMLNYKPSVHTYSKYFYPVDSLYLMHGFTADSSGITKVDSLARKKIAERIKKKDGEYDNSTEDREIYQLASDNIKLLEGKADSKFGLMVNTLFSSDTSKLGEMDKAILQYAYSPINEDGFRSISFKNHVTRNTKILLLGDSFTWGHSASGKSNSFADILLANGYLVYNTGISAADVAQYLTIAQKYIPLLKPDIVIVNFYIGNDVTYYRREVKPFTPIFFPTNAGHLMSFQYGKYFTDANEAYSFYLKRWQIRQNNLINRVLSETVITTLTWKMLANFNLIDFLSADEGFDYEAAEKNKYDKPYCNYELKQIKQITEEHGARFILSSIPQVEENVFKTAKDYSDLFNELEYIEMPVSKGDYKSSDTHFSNIGHQRYADFLIKHIESRE